MTDYLDIEGVSVSFGAHRVLDQVSLSLAQGEMTCLLGPSGSGKTTLLRAIAGFQSVESGAIRLNGLTLSQPGLMLRPEARGIGLVFQDFALFPHLTVEQNVGFGISKLSPKDRRLRVEHLLDVVSLSHLRGHYPHQISGGEKQRVSIARALAPDPRLLLLDEPLSQLDPDLRTHLAGEIRRILKSLGATALMVTHSQSEAFDFGDRIAVIQAGQLKQFDTAYQLYHEPADSFVADFIGRGTFVEAEVVTPESLRLELGEVFGQLPPGLQCGEKVITLVRPDDVVYDEKSPLRLKVISRSFRGPYFLYQLETPQGQRILALIPSHHRVSEGDRIAVRLKMDHLICFPLRPPRSADHRQIL